MCHEARHRVLIVEDDGDIRANLLEILADEGYLVAAVGDGAQALELLAAGPLPCAMLLDLQMPVVDGWNVLARMRADPRLRDVAVIVLSASDAPEGEVFLRKPTRVQALLDAVERACDAGGT
jgi:CheY-like chemotaxis protein